MRTAQRPAQERARQNPSGDGTDGMLDSLRAEAEHFLAAGDEAINRALDGSDSEAFLRAGRQQGGE